jgi:hypothetical protein
MDGMRVGADFWLGRSRFIHLSVRLEIHDREDGMGNEGWDG